MTLFSDHDKFWPSVFFCVEGLFASDGYTRRCNINNHEAKKNKLFDCPLITFQRVGRSVRIFFFFYFQHKTSKSRNRILKTYFPDIEHSHNIQMKDTCKNMYVSGHALLPSQNMLC